MQPNLHQERAEKRSSTGFWKTGLVLALGIAALVIGEGAQFLVAVDALTNTEVKQIRSSHPAANWAFQEWDNCQLGHGRYTSEGQKPAFFTLIQCNEAVLAQATERGDKDLVSAALNAQSVAIEAAQSKLNPAWPLSLFLAAR